MNAYILTGNELEKEKFVNDLVLKNRIHPYNISVFAETLKISEARSIKRSLNIAGSGARLFVIKSSPLPEAQNALLKTLEELPDDVYFVFFDDQELLPTIVSRCLVIQLSSKVVLDVSVYEEVIRQFLSKSNFTIGSVIILVDRLTLMDSSLDVFTLALRNTIFAFINEKKFEGAFFANKILGALQEKYPLLVHNNLNKNLALSAIIYESISSRKN